MQPISGKKKEEKKRHRSNLVIDGSSEFIWGFQSYVLMGCITLEEIKIGKLHYEQTVIITQPIDFLSLNLTEKDGDKHCIQVLNV